MIFIVVICFIVMIVIYIRIFCVVWKVSIELMIVYKDGLYNIKYFGVNNNYSGGVNSSCKNYEVF